MPVIGADGTGVDSQRTRFPKNTDPSVTVACGHVKQLECRRRLSPVSLGTNDNEGDADYFAAAAQEASIHVLSRIAVPVDTS